MRSLRPVLVQRHRLAGTLGHCVCVQTSVNHKPHLACPLPSLSDPTVEPYMRAHEQYRDQLPSLLWLRDQWPGKPLTTDAALDIIALAGALDVIHGSPWPLYLTFVSRVFSFPCISGLPSLYSCVSVSQMTLYVCADLSFSLFLSMPPFLRPDLASVCPSFSRSRAIHIRTWTHNTHRACDFRDDCRGLHVGGQPLPAVRPVHLVCVCGPDLPQLPVGHFPPGGRDSVLPAGALAAIRRVCREVFLLSGLFAFSGGGKWWPPFCMLSSARAL